MTEYLIRGPGSAFVDGFEPHFPPKWTRRISWARRFPSKRETIEYIIAAELPRDECEIILKPEFVRGKDISPTTRELKPKEPKKLRVVERKKANETRTKKAAMRG
jgi:hypothetical protein